MRHVVFDIDGTLINTALANLCALHDALQYYTGREYTHEELAFSFGRSAVDTMTILGIDVSLHQAAIDLWESNLLNYADTVHYFPGVPEVVEQLHREGHPIGIVTSKSRTEYANEVILKILHHCFGVVICAEDSQKHKPNPDPLLKYAELAGVDISEVTYIGDSSYDKACALSAGARFILATWGSDSSVDMPEVPCAHSANEILNMI